MPLRITRKLGQSVYIGPKRVKVKRVKLSVVVDIDGQEVEMTPDSTLGVGGVDMQFNGIGTDRATFAFRGPREIPVLREELANAQ